MSDKIKMKQALILCAIVLCLLLQITLSSQNASATGTEDFKQWQVKNWGGMVASRTSNTATVVGTFDGSIACPNTGGWNNCFLISDKILSGYANFSVDIIVNSYIGTEFDVGIGLREYALSPPSPYDDSAMFLQYYYHSINSIGRLWFQDPSSLTYFDETDSTYLDNSDITLGNTRTYSMEYDSGTIRLFIDGVLKGSLNYSFQNYQAFVLVGIKYSGTDADVSFSNPIIKLSSNPSSDNPSSVDSSQLISISALILFGMIAATVMFILWKNHGVMSKEDIERTSPGMDTDTNDNSPEPTRKNAVEFCYHCGRPNEGRRFCIHCGQKLIK